MTRKILRSLAAAAAPSPRGLWLPAPPRPRRRSPFATSSDNADEVAGRDRRVRGENPDINVIFERIAMQDARDQFIRETAIGDGPDVVHLTFVWVKDLGTAGSCLPLNELIEAARRRRERLGRTSSPPTSPSARTARPSTACRSPPTPGPWSTTPSCLAAAGIDAVPATWDELLEASRKIKAATGKPGFGFAAGASSANAEIWFLANFYMWSDGDSLVVEDGQGGYEVGITRRAASPAIIDYYKTYLDEDLTIAGQPRHRTDNDPALLEAMLQRRARRHRHADLRRGRPLRRLARAQPGRGAAVHHRHDAAWQRLSRRRIWAASRCASTPRPSTPRRPGSWSSGSTPGSSSSSTTPSSTRPSRACCSKRPFPAEMEGFQKQFTEGARSWGPYARGPGRDRGDVEPDLAQLRLGAYRRARPRMRQREEIVAFVQDQL